MNAAVDIIESVHLSLESSAPSSPQSMRIFLDFSHSMKSAEKTSIDSEGQLSHTLIAFFKLVGLFCEKPTEFFALFGCKANKPETTYVKCLFPF